MKQSFVFLFATLFSLSFFAAGCGGGSDDDDGGAASDGATAPMSETSSDDSSDADDSGSDDSDDSDPGVVDAVDEPEDEPIDDAGEAEPEVVFPNLEGVWSGNRRSDGGMASLQFRFDPTGDDGSITGIWQDTNPFNGNLTGMFTSEGNFELTMPNVGGSPVFTFTGGVNSGATQMSGTWRSETTSGDDHRFNASR